MPRIALKRREPLVKFVRRAARGHLDTAERALRAGANGGKRTRAHAAQARRELLRLRALLQLVRGPLGTTAYGREHGAVQRLVRRITPHAAAHDTATTKALAAFASPSGKDPAKDPGKAPGKDAKPPASAGPALLRALADVAEIRVRAAHWHLPEAGFDALAPALRRVWRQSARPVNHGPQAAASSLAPAALAQAALTLHDQLRCLERMWPDAIDAPRRLARALDAGERVLLGVDFGLGYPAGFADAAGLTGDGPPWRRTWDYLKNAIQDGPDNTNNRFAVAAELNGRLAQGNAARRFWACPPSAAGPHLTTRRPPSGDDTAPPARRRVVEQRIQSAHELWKLFTTGSVGGQTLLGIAWLARLLDTPGLAGRHGVWPFSEGFAAPGTGGLLGGGLLTVAEVYPRLSDDAAGDELLHHAVRDAAQVRTLAGMLASRAADGRLAAWLGPPRGLDPADTGRCVSEEGWILGEVLK